MAKTVYILGAGVNRCLATHDGLRPPLAQDVFQQALNHPRIGAPYSLERLKPLLVFIEKYWHWTLDDLKNRPFHLEECFTHAELDLVDASRSGDNQSRQTAWVAYYLLGELLLDLLSEFEIWTGESRLFAALASEVLRENAAVLTFNYDTLFESAVERQSPRRTGNDVAFLFAEHDDSVIRDEEVGFSAHEWHPYSAYRLSFDEVTLRVPGLPKSVSGDRFFAHPRNAFRPPAILKMHGSLGWFLRSGYGIDGKTMEDTEHRGSGQTILRRGFHRMGVPEIDYEWGEALVPMIITPVLNKPYDQHPFFDQIWNHARAELSECERLVVIGYSFPPTDFHTRRLLREAFAERHLSELHVVNPDHAIAGIVRSLCNFKQPIHTSDDLSQFIGAGV